MKKHLALQAVTTLTATTAFAFWPLVDDVDFSLMRAALEKQRDSTTNLCLYGDKTYAKGAVVRIGEAAWKCAIQAPAINGRSYLTWQDARNVVENSSSR